MRKAGGENMRKGYALLAASVIAVAFLLFIGVPVMAQETNPPVVKIAAANPPVITNDGKTYTELTVHVIDDTAVNNISIDLTPIGGTSVLMFCKSNYTEDNKIVSIFNYTTNATCSPGTYTLRVYIDDIYGNSNDTEIPLTISQVGEWYVSMSAGTATEGSNPKLGFGTNVSATDGFDSGLDVPHPPPGPGAEFDAYFIMPEAHPFLGNKLDVDYRAPAEEIEWTLHVESTNEEIEITWDSSQVPRDFMLTMDTDGDGIADVDMIAENNITINAGTHNLIIRAKKDTIPPTIYDLTPQPNTTIYETRPIISASYYDEGTGIDISSVRMMVDGEDVTALATVTENNISYTPATDMEEGMHTVYVSVADRGGLIAEEEWTFEIIRAVVYNISLGRGWNMISIPVDGEITVPSDVVAIYKHTPGAGYTPIPREDFSTEAEIGRGYWAAALEPCNITIIGTPVINYTVSLGAGWNMIGSTFTPVSVNDIQDKPAGSVLPEAVYWFNSTTRSYEPVDTIEPGKGYWIPAMQACNLTVGGPPAAP